MRTHIGPINTHALSLCTEVLFKLNAGIGFVIGCD